MENRKNVEGNLMSSKDNASKAKVTGHNVFPNLSFYAEYYGVDFDPQSVEKQEPESVEKPKIKNVFDRLKDYVIKCLKK
jgi:hypothetical protein